MTLTSDQMDVLEILYRLGADDIRKNVYSPKANLHLRWEHDRFWSAIKGLIDGKLIEDISRGYVNITLAGRRTIEEKLIPRNVNHISIGTMNNSSLQQAGSNSVLMQTISYRADQTDDLKHLIRLLETHFNDLRLEPQPEKKARSQINTIKAQLDDEPDPIIIKQAGRTLRNVIEGSVGSLAATAVQPTVWEWVKTALTTLF